MQQSTSSANVQKSALGLSRRHPVYEVNSFVARRGEEAKSLVRAQVISHLEWIKKGREKEERGEKDWKGRDGQNLRTPHIMYEAWKKTGC